MPNAAGSPAFRSAPGSPCSSSCAGPEIEGFVAVSPPANKFDFTFLAPCPSSGLILHGGADDLVPEPEVAELANKLQSQRQIEIDYEVIEGAGHFYERKLDALSQIVERYVARRIA